MSVQKTYQIHSLNAIFQIHFAFKTVSLTFLAH